ncbi:unnamed protein product [Rodentolepis nana]|uniref:Methyltransf_2 domain-containing protein n=1 Tax=Rodentolepis nana TaxID=102285 RepID=A0A0R3TJX2_RODNA|nr:unnamed protein product [Rodentolepis nana]
MTTNNGDTYNDISGDPFNTAEEVPCMDAVSPNQLEEVNHLKSYILNRIRRHCAKTLMGPWANPQNIDIVEVGGGLSNYLYKAQLKPEAIDSSCSVPKEVFIRVYGELLRSNMNSVILDAVLFALLSEKRLGPKLFGVFPGGRIEEFVELSIDVPPTHTAENLYGIIYHSISTTIDLQIMFARTVCSLAEALYMLTAGIFVSHFSTNFSPLVL